MVGLDESGRSKNSREISKLKYFRGEISAHLPTTAKRGASSLDDIIADLGGAPQPPKARKTGKAKRAPTSSTAVRGANGRFLPGRSYTNIHGTRVHNSERSRLNLIRAKRRVVLNALKELRAAKKAGTPVERGAIKRLRDISRQLLNQSKLTRGL